MENVLGLLLIPQDMKLLIIKCMKIKKPKIMNTVFVKVMVYTSCELSEPTIGSATVLTSALKHNGKHACTTTAHKNEKKRL